MKKKSITVVILILAIVIMLSGCAESEKTIKLTFSKYDINETFQFNDEIKKYTDYYCEFYRNIISLYNHEITDNLSHSLDYYDEYKLSFSIFDEMQSMIDNMESDESKELAIKMQVNIASTNYLLTTINLDIQEESVQKLYTDIVNNYEYICDGE